MPDSKFRYPWPASGIDRDTDMVLLHAARERSSPRIPITVLISKAIQSTYGRQTGERPCVDAEKNRG